MGRSARLVFFGLSVLFILTVLGQAFLAGLGLFRSGETWGLHGGIGHLAVVIPFFMLILSLALRLGRRSYWYTGLLLLGVVLQAEVFAVVRGSLPLAAAFHPVLAVLLFAGGGLVARHAWSVVRQPVAPRDPERVECLPAVGEPLAQGATC